MKINNVKMQYQSDPKYKNLVMTFPQWQDKPDTIGQYGCKLTAFLNAYNLYNENIEYMTIAQLNTKILYMNGYKYHKVINDYPGNINKQKELCLNQESTLLDSVLFDILGIDSCIRNYEKKITKKDMKSKHDFFIIKTRYLTTGHFSLIIGKNYKYVDSYNCKKVKPKKDDILEIRKIAFKKQ